MRMQAQKFDSTCLIEDIIEVDFLKKPYLVIGTKSKYLTHAIIIATGSHAKKLNIPGANENEFWQKGVTACAICDGAAPIFRRMFAVSVSRRVTVSRAGSARARDAYCPNR